MGWGTTPKRVNVVECCIIVLENMYTQAAHESRKGDVLARWQNLRVEVGNIMSWFKHAWKRNHHCWRKYSSQHKRRGFGGLLSRARIKKQGPSNERSPDIHPHLTSWKLYFPKRLHQHPVRCSADQRLVLCLFPEPNLTLSAQLNHPAGAALLCQTSFDSFWNTSKNRWVVGASIQLRLFIAIARGSHQSEMKGREDIVGMEEYDGRVAPLCCAFFLIMLSTVTRKQHGHIRVNVQLF